jgi:hypothetical protein
MRRKSSVRRFFKPRLIWPAQSRRYRWDESEKFDKASQEIAFFPGWRSAAESQRERGKESPNC